MGTADLVRSLNIIKQYKQNKVAENPCKTLVGVLAGVYISAEENEKLSESYVLSNRLGNYDVDENERPSSAPAAIKHGTVQTPPPKNISAPGGGVGLTLDVESAASEYYARMKQTTAGKMKDDSSGARRKVSVGEAGSTPKQEWQFNQYERSNNLR
jgi:hypothetical protein